MQIFCIVDEFAVGYLYRNFDFFNNITFYKRFSYRPRTVRQWHVTMEIK